MSRRMRGASWALLLMAACSDDAPSVLEPAGPGARRIEGLWWLMFWISLVVFVVVVALLIVALLRRTKEAAVDRSEVRWGEPFIIVAGVVIPAIVLSSVYVIALNDMNELAAHGDDAGTTIEVIGHDWWWEVVYANGAVTANEIHIPAGEPVRVELSTDDVIHSFWVPELQVKIDMNPGETNDLWLEADEPGRYRGQCAEYCGLQHAKMIFYVVAEPRAEFDQWLANEAEPAAADDLGQQVFLNSTCVGCHAIRGTDATAEVGPDLTHLAARETIASGVLPNTRSSLARWITDPQSVKPGATMPPTELAGDELEALLDYLSGLD